MPPGYPSIHTRAPEAVPNARYVVRGALIGAGAGMVMAMWSMSALAVVGDGFWAPVNAIAHAVWDGSPLTGELHPGGLAVGVAVHMAVSMMLGAVIFVLASAVGDVRARSVVALVVPLAAWVGQSFMWERVDELGARVIDEWILFVGHVTFGIAAAAGVFLEDRVWGPARSSNRSRAPAAA